MSQKINKSGVVPSEMYGQRADVVLAELFSEFSRSQLTQWLKSGFVKFDDKVLKPKEKVTGGETVILQAIIQSVVESHQPENIPLSIVFEDEAILVINKPASLVVHPGAGNAKGTLVNALLHHDNYLEHLPRAGIVHRLDKDTTGLLVIAKTLQSHTELVRMMQNREINRHYLALVYGYIISGSRIETFYGRHPKNRLKMSVLPTGKEAITDFSVKKHYNNFTLVDVSLLTGRTHQIRVHMSHINHPIVGDGLYGGRLKIPSGVNEEFKLLLRQFDRQALHAYLLSFSHPVSGVKMKFEAPLPDDFSKLLSAMDENNESY